MNGAPHQSLLGDDPVFVARYKAAIERAPAEERAIQTEIMNLCFDIERTIRACATDLKDRNVAMPRTVDTGVHPLASGTLPDARR